MDQEGKSVGHRIETINGRDYPHLQLNTPTQVDKHFYPKGFDYIIDFEHSPTLQKLYQDAETHFATITSPQEGLAKLKDIVSHQFPHRSLAEVENFRFRLKTEKQGTGMSLEDYAAKGTGHCSQTTLTTMLLFEKLKEKGLIDGDLVLEEAHWENDFTAGGHTWAKYIGHNEKPIIVDVVREYIGGEEGYKEVLEGAKWETLTNY